jgi:hypothetical protein
MPNQRGQATLLVQRADARRGDVRPQEDEAQIVLAGGEHRAGERRRTSKRRGGTDSRLPSSARTLSPISSTSMIFISGAPGSVDGDRPH